MQNYTALDTSILFQSFFSITNNTVFLQTFPILVDFAMMDKCAEEEEAEDEDAGGMSDNKDWLIRF